MFKSMWKMFFSGAAFACGLAGMALVVGSLQAASIPYLTGPGSAGQRLAQHH